VKFDPETDRRNPACRVALFDLGNAFRLAEVISLEHLRQPENMNQIHRFVALFSCAA
jgi:hypothetical protein